MRELKYDSTKFISMNDIDKLSKGEQKRAREIIQNCNDEVVFPNIKEDK
ncbi:hypothetical protein G8T75_12855 [Clostridium botulinum D/C]|nr:hypothetical protein [Clostridium botulinum]MCD3240847.1 hypothetical protein [Clostridium botulinum D/C]